MDISFVPGIGQVSHILVSIKMFLTYVVLSHSAIKDKISASGLFVSLNPGVSTITNRWPTVSDETYEIARISDVQDSSLFPTLALAELVATLMNCPNDIKECVNIMRRLHTLLFPTPVGPITLMAGVSQ